MKCFEDIAQFNSFIQRQRLYQFLAGINENMDKERHDLLNQDPLPTIEMAYAMIHWELVRRGIMGATSSLGMNPSEIGKGLESKADQKPHSGMIMEIGLTLSALTVKVQSTQKKDVSS